MKGSYISLLFSGILLLNVNSQDFSVEDIEAGRLRELAPDNLENLQWISSPDMLVFSQNDTLYEYNFNKNSRKVLATLHELNKLMHEIAGKELNSFPQIKFNSIEIFCFLNSNSMYSFSTTENKLERIFLLPPDFDHLAFDNLFSHAAFTLDSNVYLLDRYGNQKQITNDSIHGITNGQIVYRQEFGIEQGIFWSPRGSYFAFYHKDEKKVGEYPLVRIDKSIAELQNIRYPMAGTTNETTEIWVYSVKNDRLIHIEMDSLYDYHTNIAWSTDESAIYIQHLNREQNEMTLKSYSIPDGKFQKEYFTESDEEYVEPLHPVVFSERNPSDFYYQSLRDGYNHIFKYESGSDSLVQITKGLWEVTEFLGYDKKEENLFFIATKENPMERHLYKYHLNRKTIERLTAGAGTHAVIMNAEKTCFIDRLSSYSIPNQILVEDVKGSKQDILLEAPNPVIGYNLGEVMVDKIMAADDSTEIYYRLVKPAGFDPSKKYPVVVYVYGGPHVQLITNSWMGRIDYLQQYFAQHGYISFTIDPRGSYNRGAGFEQVIHRQSGIPQLEDHVKGIEFLRTLPYVDTSRIGVHGWSYGGYMTVFMMLSHPEIFKVGVSGGPVIDWQYYEIMYGERYMDTPEENPAGYKLTNLRNYADKLQGKLLIIHGALDPTVVWQHSLSFLQECIKNGVQPDYFIYPLHEHNVTGTDRIHLTRMITEYFFEHL